MANALPQWPQSCRTDTLASAWTTLLSGAEIAMHCEFGLQPMSKNGFCIMYSNGHPTPLTATKQDDPGTAFIHPVQLADIVACTLLKTLGPKGCISFAKLRRTENPTSPLWAMLAAALMPVTGLATPLQHAALIQNPHQREFVLASAYRLQKRCGPVEICRFVDEALQKPWVAQNSCPWVIQLAKFIKKRDINWAVTFKPQTAFMIIGTCPIIVSQQDKILLLLVALFHPKLAWAETPLNDTIPEPVRNAFEAVPALMNPLQCSVHRAIATCTNIAK